MKLGEALIQAGLITSEQLAQALSRQAESSERIGDILLSMGVVTPEQLAPVLAEYFHVPFFKLKDIYRDIKPRVIDAIPQELAYRFTVIPVEIKEKNLIVAMFDPLDLVAIDTLELKTGYKIKPVVALESEILEAMEYCYTSLPRLQESVDSFVDMDIQAQEEEPEVPDYQMAADDRPVVQYVKSLIVQAVNSRASDILLDPKQDRAELRFRIDGVLHHIEPPPKSMLPAIIARIKILSGMDISERRLPQDGRMKVKFGKSDIDIRTSTFPTLFGESVVMRLLDASQPLVGLGSLGFEEDDLAQYRQLLREAYGLILVTGPTGSGKTTTLYASLNEIKSSEKNIMTLEDPVEYCLPFIKQAQVNAQIGFDFKRGLRSILRQDPDIIMVGEIRDRETAEIAIQAALTGHLVLATLHTNDSVGAPIRLMNMGVEPFLISSSLLCVVAQRLVRVICPDCRQTISVDPAAAERLPFTQDLTSFCRGAGCPNCRQSGYKGREAIVELLVPDEKICEQIFRCCSSDEIRTTAMANGMRTLRQLGIKKLKDGITSPEEILRVTKQRGE